MPQSVVNSRKKPFGITEGGTRAKMAPRPKIFGAILKFLGAQAPQMTKKPAHTSGEQEYTRQWHLRTRHGIWHRQVLRDLTLLVMKFLLAPLGQWLGFLKISKFCAPRVHQSQIILTKK
uniref:Uncharacterized protein n=1 Tax=Romanomermis culicivorax TaxID=13658 RepID=A0A915JFW5_ROMCU